MSLDLAQLAKDGYGILSPPCKGVYAVKGDIGINAKGEEVPAPDYDTGDDDGSKPKRAAKDATPTAGSKSEVKASVEKGGRGKRTRRGSAKSDAPVSSDGESTESEPSVSSAS